jgi:hypothetical protein
MPVIGYMFSDSVDMSARATRHFFKVSARPAMSTAAPAACSSSAMGCS